MLDYNNEYDRENIDYIINLFEWHGFVVRIEQNKRCGKVQAAAVPMERTGRADQVIVLLDAIEDENALEKALAHEHRHVEQFIALRENGINVEMAFQLEGLFDYGKGPMEKDAYAVTKKNGSTGTIFRYPSISRFLIDFEEKANWSVEKGLI